MRKTSSARSIRQDIQRQKEPELLVIRIFDLLLPATSCGPGGCGCGPSGCGPSPVSVNLMQLQALAHRLIEKHGKDTMRFELLNVLDDSMRDYKDVYEILREKKGEALPIISINGEVKFVGKLPTFKEMDQKIRMVM